MKGVLHQSAALVLCVGVCFAAAAVGAIGAAQTAPFFVRSEGRPVSWVAQCIREVAKERRIDLVIVDYADLMAPERVTDNTIENSKSIYVNLRGLAMQEGFALLTATQTNREGAKKAVATMTDVSDDFNKIRIADIVISINKDDADRMKNEARLYFAASRNQRSGMTIRVEQDQDRAKFIKKVIGED
jgi:replicative DNA helicase